MRLGRLLDLRRPVRLRGRRRGWTWLVVDANRAFGIATDWLGRTIKDLSQESYRLWCVAPHQHLDEGNSADEQCQRRLDQSDAHGDRDSAVIADRPRHVDLE